MFKITIYDQRLWRLLHFTCGIIIYFAVKIKSYYKFYLKILKWTMKDVRDIVGEKITYLSYLTEK